MAPIRWTAPWLGLILLLFACSPRVAPSRPGDAGDRPRHTLEQFLATTHYAGVAWSGDGRGLLVTSDRSGAANVVSLSLDGEESLPLTRSPSPVELVAAFPEDGRFLYLADVAGNEWAHLYVQAGTGEPRDLTPGEKVKSEFAGWASGGRSFFYATNERDGAQLDVYEMEAEGYGRRLLMRNEAGHDLGAVSGDGRFVVLSRLASQVDSDLYLWDRENGATVPLTPHTGKARFSPKAFSPDGRSFFHTSNQDAEHFALVRYETASKEHTVVFRPPGDVLAVHPSPDGRTLAVLVDEEARTVLRLLDGRSFAPLPAPDLPPGTMGEGGLAFSPDGRRLALTVESGRSPRDLYVVDLDAPASPARRLTRALGPELREEELAEPRTFRFRSFDGLEVPGLLYEPPGLPPGERAPAVIVVHGGPGEQSRLGYRGFVQFLVDAGYAVYAINHRGSSGYGKTFLSLARRKHGEADLDDCVAAKGALAATGRIDAGRIAILGGSYGGYMVLAALAFRPTEFAAGVDFYGISNWPRTLESIPVWRTSVREALFDDLGDPAVDGEALRRISPLFHAERIVRPLMVIQGANDPRVLKSESDDIVAAVRKNGVPVEYLLFPDEGHGILRKENQLTAYRAVLAFLDRHLRGAKVPR